MEHLIIFVCGGCIGMAIATGAMIWAWLIDRKAEKERIKEGLFKPIWKEIDELKLEIKEIEDNE